MRTSLNEIREVESFLTNNMLAGESLVFQAKLITNPLLRFNLSLQKRLMAAVQLYHRRKLKHDLKQIHSKLLASNEKTSFQQSVNLFKL